MNGSPCKLALADGIVVNGYAIGHQGETGGELCFNTSMTGYQEIMTDPSYHGQIMMMTYPHIGNYGAMDIDMEADMPDGGRVRSAPIRREVFPTRRRTSRWIVL